MVMSNYMETIINMQMYNHFGQYSMSKKIYEKYHSLIPKDNLYLHNKCLNEYEIATKKFILDSKPRNLQVVLFDKCQSNCIMCTQKNKKYNYTLSNNHFNEIVLLFPYLDTIMWQGGEVFLWRNFVDIIKNTSKYKQITQSIITNFQSIDENTIEELSKINNLKLIISIDGASKNTYEKIRRGSNFKKLIRNINSLNKYIDKNKSLISLHINFVILKENYNEILDIIDFAKKYNFHTVSFIECTSTFDYSNIFNADIKIQIENMLKFAMIKAFKNKIGINIQYPSKIFNLKKAENKKKGYMICKIPWYKLLLGEDYTFAPECTCFKRENYYKNKDSLTIFDMWNSDIMQNYRKHIIGLKENKKICNSKCILYAPYYFENMAISN